MFKYSVYFEVGRKAFRLVGWFPSGNNAAVSVQKEYPSAKNIIVSFYKPKEK